MRIVYSCKISNINEIPIILEYLYDLGFRKFNTANNIKSAKKFYVDRFVGNNELYINWAMKDGKIAKTFDFEKDSCVGYNDTVYLSDYTNRLFNIQKIIREKKLNRILK